jgi:hypothetical protein
MNCRLCLTSVALMNANDSENAEINDWENWGGGGEATREKVLAVLHSLSLVSDRYSQKSASPAMMVARRRLSSGMLRRVVW